MLSLEPEIERFRGILGDGVTNALVARERREVFSIYPELRLCAWGGALLLASAAGVVLKNNLARIGPLALAVMVGLAAAACYAWVWHRRRRASLVDDYILLLGSLLVSADVAFVETQFRLLGDSWHRHLLLLAVVHGAAAYLYRSRMVLSLSIAALAGWLGIETKPFAAFEGDPTFFATRAFLCSAILLAWRFADRRLTRKHAVDFAPVFEHFAANLALAGGLALMIEDGTRTAGGVITLAAAGAVILWGFRTRSEWFVLYAFVYAVIAVDVLVIDAIGTGIEQLVFLVIAGSMIGAVIALFAIHARFRRLRA